MGDTDVRGTGGDDEREKPADAAERSQDELPDKKVLGLPYDLRRPTLARTRLRLYNADEPRMFPPKAFGVGWTVNFYWIVHPFAYFRNHQKSRQAS